MGIESYMTELFEKRLEELTMSNNKIEELLGTKRIYLKDILKTVDEGTKKKIMDYECQSNAILSEYCHMFYDRGFKDCLSFLINEGRV